MQRFLYMLGLMIAGEAVFILPFGIARFLRQQKMWTGQGSFARKRY